MNYFKFLLISFSILITITNYTQNIESITFSAVASSNDVFQPVVGTPYSSTLSGANGSLEVSSSFGEGSFEEPLPSTNKEDLVNKIKVFPNPSNYLLNIDLSETSGANHQLVLSNLSGRKVWATNSKSINRQLDLSNYANGTYLLSIQEVGSQKIENFKIVKIK
jgi:hypothetical protein